ncbi:MAG TPA: nucleotidyltransferase family protein [Methanoregulaceae archaeon]|nr:nucleotidyltransferase family protein [Methanoregulaceae archaeon]
MVSATSEWVGSRLAHRSGISIRGLPLAGGRPNALLPADRLLSLAAVLRDTPRAAPALSLEAWREFLDLLRPHGVYALLAYRLGAWPEDCRPPAEVMDFLKRQHLVAAAPGLPETSVPPWGPATATSEVAP